MDNQPLPLLDTIDMEILMHRDAHFGKNFDVMIDYYAKDGVGAMHDFDLSRIRNLKEIETQERVDLAEALLPEAAKEEVQKCLELYRDLEALFDKDPKPKVPCLIADLILSEEEMPQKEIDALAENPDKVVAPLLDLLHSKDFTSPISPGYGHAPYRAALCFHVLQSESSIAPLFEALGHSDFATDEALFKALRHQGEEAKTFLLKRLKHKPYCKESDNAASSLAAFGDDATVAQAALTLLEDPEVQQRSTLAPTLVFLTAPLEEAKDQERLIALLNNKDLNNELVFEINSIKKVWNK